MRTRARASISRGCPSDDTWWIAESPKRPFAGGAEQTLDMDRRRDRVGGATLGKERSKRFKEGQRFKEGHPPSVQRAVQGEQAVQGRFKEAVQGGTPTLGVQGGTPTLGSKRFKRFKGGSMRDTHPRRFNTVQGGTPTLERFKEEQRFKEGHPPWGGSMRDTHPRRFKAVQGGTPTLAVQGGTPTLGFKEGHPP